MSGEKSLKNATIPDISGIYQTFGHTLLKISNIVTKVRNSLVKTLFLNFFLKMGGVNA